MGTSNEREVVNEPQRWSKIDEVIGGKRKGRREERRYPRREKAWSVRGESLDRCERVMGWLLRLDTALSFAPRLRLKISFSTHAPPRRPISTTAFPSYALSSHLLLNSHPSFPTHLHSPTSFACPPAYLD